MVSSFQAFVSSSHEFQIYNNMIWIQCIVITGFYIQEVKQINCNGVCLQADYPYHLWPGHQQAGSGCRVRGIVDLRQHDFISIYSGQWNGKTMTLAKHKTCSETGTKGVPCNPFKMNQCIKTQIIHSSWKEMQLFESCISFGEIVDCERTMRKSGKQSFANYSQIHSSQMFMTLGDWPWHRGIRENGFRQVAFLLRKSVY